MTSKAGENAKDLNWADYCDAQANEAWLESQKSNRPAHRVTPRKDPELIASEPRPQSRFRDDIH